MLDGLRTEFPALERISLAPARLHVSRESPLWAFVSAIGAAFIVGGITTIAALVVYPLVFPRTEPGPSFSPAVLGDLAAAVAAGAVAMHAGRVNALLLYA